LSSVSTKIAPDIANAETDFAQTKPRKKMNGKTVRSSRDDNAEARTRAAFLRRLT
jgi:hypothetical protein